MGIRNLQITRHIENTIKKYLYRGRYPTFSTITHHMSKWLRDHTPGTPTFHPVKVFRKEKSNAERYNQHIEDIHQDITDAYDTTIQQNKRIMEDFHFIHTEREKLIHELSSISRNIDELLLISNNADYKYFDGYTIGFEDAKDINKKESSILIDLANQEVTLSENSNQSNRVIINPKKATFETLMPSHKNSALESIEHAFDGNINTSWWQVVKTKELGDSNRMKAQISIMFDQEEEINTIEYIPHHGNPINVSIEYTRDGSTFTPIYQKAEMDQVTGIKIWNFPITTATGIRFIFEKTEHDERSNDYYNYYFGAKSINIFKKNYLSKGTLYTNPITFNEEVRQLSMFAKSNVPSSTSIKYEIALHQDNTLLEDLIWHPISSYDETKAQYAKVVNLNVKETKKVEASKAEATGEVINGMQVFRLMKNNGDGIVSENLLNTQTDQVKETFDSIYRPKLFRGINQWRRERTYIPFDGSIPLNSKWNHQYKNKPHLIRSDYQNKSNRLDLSRPQGGFDDNFYRFSICIYSEEERNEPLSLSVITTLASGSRKRLGAYAVYVNQKRLSPTNDEVTMNFIRGWNEVQILFHWGDMERRTDTERDNLPNETILGKFNFARERQVRGDKEPLQYVESHTLYHNISPNNRNYFAVHERQVVLNYLPVNCIFQLSYESEKPIETNNQVIVRAILKRDDKVPHLTPKIYNIRLQAK